MTARRLEARAWSGQDVVLVLCTLLAAARGSAQQAELAALRATIAALPAVPGHGAEQVRVVDWRSGRPLADALVVLVPSGRVTNAAWECVDPHARRRLWLQFAAQEKTRVALDAHGMAPVPGHPHILVVVHGETHTVGGLGDVVPYPVIDVPLEFVHADGRPVTDSPLADWELDANGRCVAAFDHRILGSQRHAILQAIRRADAPEVFGPLPAGTAPVDLYAPRAAADRVRITLPAVATLILDGKHQGAHSEFGPVDIYWSDPFAPNVSWRKCASAASTVVRGLPAGIPLSVRQWNKRPLVVTLPAGETSRLELPVVPPRASVRYRLVDAQGRPLQGTLSRASPSVIFNRTRSEVVVPVANETIILELTTADGATWSCAPFQTPQIEAPGEHDGGNCVLRPDEQQFYCDGLILDWLWRPVCTNIWLYDDPGVHSATHSDREGRFRMHAPAWCEGEFRLHTPGFTSLTPHRVARGARNLVLLVAPRQDAVIAGQVLGMSPRARGVPITVHARRRSADRYEASQSLDATGGFSLRVPPGVYDVSLRTHDDTVLLAAEGVEARAGTIVAPASLRAPLPASHRSMLLHFVGADGQPCPILWVTGYQSALRQVVVRADSRFHQLHFLMPRVPVQPECTIVVDPVLVPVQVRGLPAASPWHFGLRVAPLDRKASSQAAELVAGSLQLHVLRGITLRCELLAQRYDREGALYPQEDAAVLDGFAPEIHVPATGTPAPVVLEAPASLAAQLANFERLHGRAGR